MCLNAKALFFILVGFVLSVAFLNLVFALPQTPVPMPSAVDKAGELFNDTLTYFDRHVWNRVQVESTFVKAEIE